MSNFLAIATVTATLKQMLQAGVQADVTGVSITISTTRPDTTGPQATPTGVNVYLYQVTPNPALRNADLPTRNGSGTLVRRPRTALDLHYLLSFYGDDALLEPQRILGSTVRILNAHPLLTRDQITATITNPTFNYLSGSDLADELETVRFTPAAITLDELAKIWSVFYEMPYALSIVYIASVVFIEGRESFPAAPPVQQFNAYTIPTLGPHVDQLLAQSAPGAPVVADPFILPGYLLVVRGERLSGDSTKVTAGGVEITPAADQISAHQITVALPASLPPGVQSMQVLQPFNIGTPPIPHRGLASNVVPFVLHPTATFSPQVTASRTIDGVTFRDGTVRVTFTPRIGLRQRVVLELNERDAAAGAVARGYTFGTSLPHAPNPPGASDTDIVDVSFTNVIAGTYLARVQVDGADSPLDSDVNGKYVGPAVTI